MEIVIGTYEEFLVGYVLKKDKDKFILEQSFTNHAHCGSVRSIASSGKYLASGSIDEMIHIISMKHRVDSGTLISHTGTITALEFLRSAYLFSASDDGNICIWNTKKQWQCEKFLRGHKEAVNSLSIHSSGKLLLSVSKDKTLRTWNLIKGRCAYIVNLKDIAHQVLWSPTCLYFAVVFEYHVDIYDLSTGGVLHSIEKDAFDNKRINKVSFIDDNNIIISGDSNDIVIYNFISKKVVSKFTLHENRIKDLTWVNLKTVGEDLVDQKTLDSTEKWLLTTSSDGFIKVWSLDFSNLEQKPNLVTQVNSTCRPTCLAVWTSNQNTHDKFDSFELPELKISKEELEVCKSKLKKRKRVPFKKLEEEEKIETEKDAELEPVAIKKPEKNRKNKKAKIVEEQIMPPVPHIPKEAEDEEEDDDEAIRKMKASSDVLKQMNKYRKGKKKNVTTFKQRQQQQKTSKGDGFKVDKVESSRKRHSNSFNRKSPRGGFQQNRNNDSNNARGKPNRGGKPFRPTNRSGRGGGGGRGGKRN